jgi:hypothetical protein
VPEETEPHSRLRPIRSRTVAAYLGVSVVLVVSGHDRTPADVAAVAELYLKELRGDVLVIPTNDELAMARAAWKFV